MKNILINVFVLLLSSSVFAQNDLLDELTNELEESSEVSSVFKSLKIVNLESTKMAAKGDFYFVIAHRFGTVKNGFKDLFGLDESNIRFSFIYGFNDWWTAGLSRSSIEKTFDLTTKLKLKTQEKNGFPLNIVGFAAMGYKTGDPDPTFVLYENKHRANYLAQLLVSRKMNEKLSLQASPTFLHENFTEFDTQKNSQYGLGLGGRYKLTKRLTLNLDYLAHFNRATENTFQNPLSVGVDIETGGHVFQLHFSNSQRMNDAGFIHANGDWSDGNVFFGFNLYRVF
ncbi:DUF5777 family beta-barrel protein [Flavicella sediminum]|uniref:DUF5777 family beta-barrel protein n=1 Tax=Flavicella sediminum TaxID=2585141 RepID=UPI001121DDF2|nr:DUF5777 family beta-barrel protein [Flavicella sediminum]